MTKRWIAILAGPVAVLALVTGCGDSSNGSADGDETSADATPAPTDGAPATETTGTLATETGGTETPGPTQDADVSIVVAGLPIGGNGSPGRSHQCVSVSYLGDDNDPPVDIPSGARITLTEVSFAVVETDENGVDEDALVAAPVALGGDACSTEETPCLSSDFAFTAEDDGTCFVPVHATNGPADKTDEEQADFVVVALSVTGKMTCPVGERASCEGFDPEDQSIRVDVPFVTTSSSSSSSSESSSSSSGSSSSHSSSSSSASQSAGGTSTAPN
jgi:hypothetical protein